MSNMDKLPELCYSTLESTGETIIIKRGERGYCKTNLPDGIVDNLNEKLGVTKAQEKAMYMGSLFSWEIPASDPDMYYENGKPKRIEVVKAYPEYILKKLRQREDLDEDDISMDEEFNAYSPSKAFREVCQWEGLTGSYDTQIKGWIKSIYGIDLDSKED